MFKNIEEAPTYFDRKIALLIQKKRIEILGDRIYVLLPAEYEEKKQSLEKDIKITFLGLVHGDETVGLGILNKLLDNIEAGSLGQSFKIGIALGNLDAARQKVRFVEKDLNRSFGSEAGACLEDKRSKQLEPLFKRSRYLIDFHQTIRPSEKAFFIFPCVKKSLFFAHAIDESLPIVTNLKGGSFSKDGMCSDEYVNAQGGTGITIECGQRGFHDDQMAMGFELCLKALKILKNEKAIEVKSASLCEHEIFSPIVIYPYPKDKEVSLKPGLKNFVRVAKDENLGTVAGEPIICSESGYLLFPKYKEDMLAGRPLPSELFRLVAPVDFSCFTEILK